MVDDLPKVQLRQSISTDKKETPVKKETVVKKSDKKAIKAVKKDDKIVKSDKKAAKAVKKEEKKTVKSDKKSDKKAAKAVKTDAKATKAVASASTTLSAAVVTPVAPVKLDLAIPSTVQANLLIAAVRAFNNAHSVKTIKESINVDATYARQVSKTITSDALAAIRNDVAATFDKKVTSVINKAVASASKGKLDKDGYTAALNAIVEIFPVKKTKAAKKK